MTKTTHCDRCGLEFADAQDDDTDHQATTCDSCGDLIHQLVMEHTSGMHDTAADARCDMWLPERASLVSISRNYPQGHSHVTGSRSRSRRTTTGGTDDD